MQLFLSPCSCAVVSFGCSSPAGAVDDKVCGPPFGKLRKKSCGLTGEGPRNSEDFPKDLLKKSGMVWPLIPGLRRPPR